LGTISVQTEPHEVEVFVDGVRRGRGLVTIGVEPGKPHRVEFRLAGAPVASREITVAPGATKTVRVTFPRSAKTRKGDILFLGALRSLIREKDVTVSLDGKPVFVGEGLLRDVTPGVHKIVLTRASAAKGAPAKVLLSREVKVEAGSAASMDDVVPPAAAKVGTPAPDESALARLVVQLMDEQGQTIPDSRATITFNGVALSVLRSGAWPLPVGKSGTLKVSVPGYVAETHPLHFPAPGLRYISFVLYPAPVPVLREWRALVEGSSEENALVLLRDTPGQTPAPGQTLVLVPARASSADSLRLSVLEVRDGSVICQVLPGQSKLAPPPRGTMVTVRLASPAKP
jgi:hypothetical protein